MDLKGFLQMIAGPGGNVHIRTQAGKDIQEFWIEPDLYDSESMQAAFTQKSQDEQRNMWFQVGATDKGSKSPKFAHVIWADIDLYKYPGGELQAMGLLRYLPKPTVVVRSGRGIHVYWRMSEPVPADGPMSIAQHLAKSAQWLLGADAAHAPNKLLRIPGTYNFKPDEYEGGLLCEIIQTNDVSYTIAEFPVDEVLMRVNHKLLVKIMVGPTEPGTDRSEYDFHCAAELFKNGFSEEEVKYLMRTYPFSGKIKEGVPSIENYVNRTVKSALFKVKVSGDNMRAAPKDPVVWTGKSLAEILKEEKPAFVVNDFLPKAGIAMLSAPPKARKSWAVMQLAYCAATAQDWLGFTIDTPKRVMYVQAELPSWMVAERIVQMYGATSLENVAFYHIPASNLMEDEDLQGLLDAVKDFQADLVIIDPVANFWQGDENSSASVNKLFSQIAKVQEIGAAVVMVHHSRKTEQNERVTAQHQRGSNVFFARPDAVMTLSPTLVPGEVPYTWAEFSLRAAEPKDPVKLYTDSTGQFTVQPPSLGATGSPVRQHLDALLRAKKAKEAGESPPWEAQPITYKGN
jgi:hypothetical protein